MNRMKLLPLIAAFVLCVACLGALAGCEASDEATDAASKNRAYMSQANTAMMHLNQDLTAFSAAVAESDVVTMEQAAATAYRDIDTFKAITAPEPMAKIHAEYSSGCDDLEASLQAYLQLFREAESLDDEDFNKRIGSIQEQYDSGIAHLQAGDKLVTELNGALPSSSSSAESSSSSAQ